jgi:hypothetical protein
MTTNEELERLIDRAGRDRVFEIANRLGWGPYSAPPIYVWRQIAEGLIADPQWRPAYPPQTLMEVIGLGGIAQALGF